MVGREGFLEGSPREGRRLIVKNCSFLDCSTDVSTCMHNLHREGQVLMSNGHRAEEGKEEANCLFKMAGRDLSHLFNFAQHINNGHLRSHRTDMFLLCPLATRPTQRVDWFPSHMLESIISQSL